MRRPDRILVHENSQEGNTPGVIVCTDLDTGEGWSLKYWPTHKGADGEYENPACKMEARKCYQIGLRHSSRTGYADEWMIRDATEIPSEVPPRVPNREDYILAETCLKEAGESLRNDHTLNGGTYSTKEHLEYAKELFRGTMKILAAHCGEVKNNAD